VCYESVAVHVMPHSAARSCDDLPAIAGCGDIVTTFAGSDFDAFPVFYKLREYKGVEYGMTWPEVFGTAAFTSCSDLAIGSITHPGDGVSQVWIECQASAVAIPGWLWLYADGPGLIRVVEHPVGSEGPGIYILDCSDRLTNPIPCVFGAGVSGAVGEDPCYDGTEATTWGDIKRIFAE
jgi:hypothetical protein